MGFTNKIRSCQLLVDFFFLSCFLFLSFFFLFFSSFILSSFLFLLTFSFFPLSFYFLFRLLFFLNEWLANSYNNNFPSSICFGKHAHSIAAFFFLSLSLSLLFSLFHFVSPSLLSLSLSFPPCFSLQEQLAVCSLVLSLSV